MAAHSSLLAWRIPWTEEPGGLQSMGWQSVGHDGSDLARVHHQARRKQCVSSAFRVRAETPGSLQGLGRALPGAAPLLSLARAHSLSSPARLTLPTMGS